MGLRLRHQHFLTRTAGAAVALSVILFLVIRHVETINARVRVNQTSTELQRVREEAKARTDVDWNALVDSTRFTWSIEEGPHSSANDLSVAEDTGIGTLRLPRGPGLPEASLRITPIEGLLPPELPLRPWIVSAIFTLIVISFLGWTFDKMAARPFEEMAEALKGLARGDHDISMDGPATSPEHGAMKKAIASIGHELSSRIRTGARGRRNLSTVLESMSDGVLAVDREETIILANGTSRALLDLNQTHEPDAQEVLDHVKLDEVRKSLLTCLESGHSRETRCILDQGEGPVFLELTSQPLRDIDHTILGALCVIRDVSVQHQNEQMRREFVANVSHELKTPLTAIAGAAETILQDDKISLDEALPFVGKIEQHSRRLGDLISDVLELSRLQGDDPNIEREKISVSRLIAEVFEAVEVLSNSRQVSITSEFSDEKVCIVGDHRALSSAIENIVVNAIRHTEPQGSVRVSVTSPTGEVRIAIEDTGCGIAPEHTDRVFERFFRVDPARSRQTGGTGLGLAIAKNAVMAHEGCIRVDSKLGEGTTFTIILPARE